MQTEIYSAPAETNGQAFGMSIGILFLGGFGMLWILIGLFSAGPIRLPQIVLLTGTGPLLRVLPAACYAVALLSIALYILRHSWQRRHAGSTPQQRQRIGRRFGIINCAQWALIFAAIAILNRIGQSGWTVPAVVFIVGIHFYPLASLFHDITDTLTGTALVLWAVLYPFLLGFGAADPRGAVVTGIILWISASFTAWQAMRLLRAAATPC